MGHYENCGVHHTVCVRPQDCAEIARLTAALSEAQRERDALKGEVEAVRATSQANFGYYVQAHNRAVDAEAERDAAVTWAEEQAALRRVAEDAIPRGIEVAKEFIRAEYDRRLSLAGRVVEAADSVNRMTLRTGGGAMLVTPRATMDALRSAVAEYRKAGK